MECAGNSDRDHSWYCSSDGMRIKVVTRGFSKKIAYRAGD